MFDATTYAQRRARLRDQMTSGMLLFLGNEESPMNYAANPYAFRQDSSFLYFWGLDEPGLAAVIDVDEGREVLFGRDRTLDEVVWMGPQAPMQERARAADVANVAVPEALAEQLARAQAQGRTVHYLPPYRAAHRLKLAALLGISAAEAGARASEPLAKAVIAQRSVKSDEEVAEIERALEATYVMHTLAMRMTAPGIYEREVAGAVEGVALAYGGEVSFPVIFSVRGEVLHNHDHSNRMEAGQMALLDAGGTSPMHYAGDITRVTPVSGQFTERQREVYQIVLDAQVEAIRAVRPGVKFKDVHLLAARHLAHRLKELGLMRGDVDEAVAAGAHALFFQTGLGHMMGLDVHDMENLNEDWVGYDDETERSDQFGLNHLRLARKLEPGFVLTVEPGIYFIPALIERWKAERRHEAFIDYEAVEDYRDFGGIRIEDDVLVTEEGQRVLGRSIPKTIEAVEQAAAEAEPVSSSGGA